LPGAGTTRRIARDGRKARQEQQMTEDEARALAEYKARAQRRAEAAATERTPGVLTGVFEAAVEMTKLGYERFEDAQRRDWREDLDGRYWGKPASLEELRDLRRDAIDRLAYIDALIADYESAV
jgi:hypothetical protein